VQEALVYMDTKHKQVGAPDDMLSYSDDTKADQEEALPLAEQSSSLMWSTSW